MVVELRKHQDFEQLLERSNFVPVVVFKHSTQCPVSAQAYDEFNRFAESAERAVCGVVFVLENRTLSDDIEEQLGIRHESPQVILLRNGKAIWNASHWSITTAALTQALYAESPR